MFPSPLGVIFSLMLHKTFYNPMQLVCFRLLSELYSLLCLADVLNGRGVKNTFPSPLGVIFSLIQAGYIDIEITAVHRFPSPLGVIFSLINSF